MKFQVKRTSLRGSPDAPCEGAQLEAFEYIEERPASRLDGVRYEGDASWWFGEGTNHRVEGEHILRDLVETAWVLEFNDLDSLMNFIVENRIVVVQRSYPDDLILYPKLEIYDSYRE